MIRVRVPATSANMGPGFDTLGLALNLYNEFTFEEIDGGIELIGFEKGHDTEENLVYKSMIKTLERLNRQIRGIRIEGKMDIPISRGLGSSASCILAGVMGANKIANSPLSRDEIFKIATEIEGHPDNIAPALFGGLIVSLMEDGDIIYERVEIKEGLKFNALIPEFTLSTSEARKVLPSQIDLKTGVKNNSKTAILLMSLINGNFDKLKLALNDEIHQPYRGKLIANFFDIINKVYDQGGLGAYLSGAGPTIMAISLRGNEEFSKGISEYLNTLGDKWEVRPLDIDLNGATYL